ncbi:hypothetical protein [Halococcus saccharolyticus]|uniref:Small CPxCG-related zinc finger protein n=1 Tax=Halococcus saccharolyticus DSM 5350 TaxID=1227455 RepID=M0ME26_9EURY|nr:hypothetical protein [Halococcus saccharolyticus]EMA43997.1 hypothetical protein C449_10733 [Halococcus saccharolyticus DSM 5350]
MSHVAEKPELYVCRDCQSVFVGDVSEGSTPEDHTYSAPGECSGCGNTEFIEIEEYPHFG